MHRTESLMGMAGMSTPVVQAGSIRNLRTGSAAPFAGIVESIQKWS
jgi:hypothetical protein